MNASELLKLIPERLFEELAMETKVDHQVKKLSGEVIFKLILFSILNSDKLSLRVMESFLESGTFQSFAQLTDLKSRYNSIRDRICTINATYFEKLFEQIFTIYNQQLKEEGALSKADSTYVALATRLFAAGEGIQNGPDGCKRQVKYSVVLKGSLPASVQVFTEQAYVSEDKALSQLINDAGCLKEGVVVVDRGLQSRDAFDQFTLDGKGFICRSKTNIYFKVTGQREVPDQPLSASLTILSDETGFLFKKRGQTQRAYRLIKATLDKDAAPIWLVTNLLEEDAYTIARYYKERWEIELFFKFLKQHLNLEHLVSRTENGIKVMLYMTMILATLLLAYKKLNGIKSYKIAKLKFELQLENDIIKSIVLLCGGDPTKAAHLWNTNTS